MEFLDDFVFCIVVLLRLDGVAYKVAQPIFFNCDQKKIHHFLQ